MIIEIVSIIVGILLLTVVCAGGEGILQFLTWYFDAPSLICILVLSLPILLRNGLWKDFVRAFKLQNKKYTCRLSELKRTLDAVELMQKQILYAGAISTIFPFICILGYISDLASVGPSVAVALIVALYTAILELLLLPLQVEAKRRIIAYMEEE